MVRGVCRGCWAVYAAAPGLASSAAGRLPPPFLPPGSATSNRDHSPFPASRPVALSKTRSSVKTSVFGRTSTTVSGVGHTEAFTP